MPEETTAYNPANAVSANDPVIITVGGGDEQTTRDPTSHNIAPFIGLGTTHDGFVKPETVALGTAI